jgi:hypothetical protein
VALRPTVSRGLPLSSGNAPNRNYSRLSFNKQCRCHRREDPLRHPKPLRYSKLAVLPAADCAPGHISGAPNMRNEGSFAIRGSACIAQQTCKLKCYKEIGVAAERKRPIRSPGSATMFRSQASNPVVADQWSCRNITAAPNVVEVAAVTAACWAACHPVSLLVGRGRAGSTHKAQPNTSRFSCPATPTTQDQW